MDEERPLLVFEPVFGPLEPPLFYYAVRALVVDYDDHIGYGFLGVHTPWLYRQGGVEDLVHTVRWFVWLRRRDAIQAWADMWRE